MQTKIETDGEEDICVGDVVTLTVTLTRTNLQEGEAAGFVHAPYFPAEKSEEWYVFLLKDYSTNPKIMGMSVVEETNHTTTTEIKMRASSTGRFTFTVVALSDSYAGIDQK